MVTAPTGVAAINAGGVTLHSFFQMPFGPFSIELQHIYRQSDGNFIELLNRVRNNQLDAPTLQQLNTRYVPDFKPQENDGYITLCTHNSGADAINRAKLQALPGTSRCFDALIDGNFPEHAYPIAATLELKTGAQVMFARNDASFEKRYFNGKIGKIVGMSSKSQCGFESLPHL